MKRNRVVFSTEWFNVEKVSCNDRSAVGDKPYYRINSPDGVIVLAVTERREIILVRQFRPSLGKHTIEFPAGGVDGDETPEAAAARELLEETGYVCDRFSYLGAGRLMLNRHNNLLHSFIGYGAREVASYSVQESTEVFSVSMEGLKSLVLSGQFEQYAALALFVLAEWKLGGLWGREQ